jgi:hypothetical protein
VIRQPGSLRGRFSTIIPALRDEYRIKRVTKVRPARSKNSSQTRRRRCDLPARTAGLQQAVRTDIPANSAIKDGRRT